VRDLVGEVAGLEAALGAAAAPSEFGLVQADVAPVELENYQAGAELVASTVAKAPDRLNGLLACKAGEQPRACARTFIEKFAARAYRAPLADAADTDRHLALYDIGAKVEHAHGVELVLRAVLQAPRFLYRVELGTDAQQGERARALSGYELAARLSYVFWDSLPDAELTAAADSGKLATPAGLKTALERVLAAERGREVRRRFLEQWLHLPQLASVVKDAGQYPEWNAALRTGLANQARAWLDDVLGSQAGSLHALLTSKRVFVNKALAGFYPEQAASATGDAFMRVELEEAAGVLTLPAWLALTSKPAESSPIYRGKFVREALLCQTLPAPPPNIPKPPEVSAGVSTRERLKQHEEDTACSGCHRLMDPIGFGFEHYDAIGRFRTSDGGEDVNARGELIATRDLDGSFEGVPELAERLSESAEVKECMVRQWFRFALSRFERPADACSVKSLTQAFEQRGADLRALPELLVDSPAFRYRRAIDSEDAP
jgi:hypothetical protein